VTHGLHFHKLESPCPKDYTYEISGHSVVDVVDEKKIFKGCSYINLYKTMAPESVAFCDPKDFI